MPEQPQQIILAFFQGCELMDAAVDEVAVLRHIEVAAGCFQLLLDQPEFFLWGERGFDRGTGLGLHSEYGLRSIQMFLDYYIPESGEKEPFLYTERKKHPRPLQEAEVLLTAKKASKQ